VTSRLPDICHKHLGKVKKTAASGKSHDRRVTGTSTIQREVATLSIAKFRFRIIFKGNEFSYIEAQAIRLYSTC